MTALPDSLCFLNGIYGALQDARVNVMDRGFVLGDGVYEVLPAYGGRLFRFNEHMIRLERSLRELRISNPHTQTEWLTIARRLVADQQAKGAANQSVYLQVTRGVAMRDHAMLPDLVPTVFAMGNETKLATTRQRAHGVACVTADDFRWRKAHIKSISRLGYTLRRVTRDEVLQADELLQSSSSKEVLPVTTLDNIPVGHSPHRGLPGPVYARLYAAYQQAVATQSI